jgi:hypothetical protein
VKNKRNASQMKKKCFEIRIQNLYVNLECANVNDQSFKISQAKYYDWRQMIRRITKLLVNFNQVQSNTNHQLSKLCK